MCAWSSNAVRSEEAANATTARRALGILLEGAIAHQVQADPDMHRHLRSVLLRDSMRLAEPQSEEDLLQTVSSILEGFEAYRKQAEAEYEARQQEWQLVAAMMMQLVAKHASIDQETKQWRQAMSELASARSAGEIQVLRGALQRLFARSAYTAKKVESDEEKDRSEANDNAAGLRGGGAAIEHVRKMMLEGRPGYIGVFRLSCLDVVGERFGQEGIQDCLMAVSAFLIENLRSEDSVYHWSESSLLVVCDRKIREDIVSAELNRVLQRNRDFTIEIGNSKIMLRIPIDLELFPIEVFQNADDLLKLPAKRGRGDRSLSERASARLYS